MTDPQRILLAAAVVGGAAMWLLLPRRAAGGHTLGVALGAVSLGLTAAGLPGPADWLSQSLFWVLGGVTIISAACAVTLRNPVYCAIWFGMSLVGTSGLFLFQGAQFLAVATVVVYAGAILVVFLFILMLAAPSGRARYDRVSWEGLLSAACAAFLVGVLSMAVTGAVASPEPDSPAAKITQADRHDPQHGVLGDQHVKQIGGKLFGRYLAAVEVAGTLLLAALVGAAVIVGRARGPLVEPVGPAEQERNDPQTNP